MYRNATKFCMFVSCNFIEFISFNSSFDGVFRIFYVQDLCKQNMLLKSEIVYYETALRWGGCSWYL